MIVLKAHLSASGGDGHCLHSLQCLDKEEWLNGRDITSCSYSRDRATRSTGRPEGLVEAGQLFFTTTRSEYIYYCCRLNHLLPGFQREFSDLCQYQYPLRIYLCHSDHRGRRSDAAHLRRNRPLGRAGICPGPFYHVLCLPGRDAVVGGHYRGAGRLCRRWPVQWYLLRLVQDSLAYLYPGDALSAQRHLSDYFGR